MHGNDCSSVNPEEYRLGNHVAGIFVVLFLASLGTILPVSIVIDVICFQIHDLIQVISKTVPLMRINDFTFLLLKCFGMGIILSTAFVHMLSPAVMNLSSPCLPKPMLKYSSWAGLIALFSSLMVQMIQTIAINHFTKRHSHDAHCVTHNHFPVARRSRSTGRVGDSPVEAGSSALEPKEDRINSAESILSQEDEKESSPLLRRTRAMSSESRKSIPVELGALAVATNIHSDGCCEVDHILLNSSSHHSHRQITAYILEFGIALHSLIIGITLGVTGGSEFISLLIAISFHQFFEGFALSTTALEAGFNTLTQPLLMSLLYTLTTPIGQIIGIFISQGYHQNSSSSILITGVFDAVSAGILIYDSLVNLITTNITHSGYFATLSLPRKVSAFAALWTGAAIMSIIGIWA